MAERPRHEPITVAPDGNITTEGVYQPATGNPIPFRVVSGVLSVQRDGRNWFAPNPMDRANVQKLLGADVRLEGNLLKGTPPAAPKEDPALAAAARATRARAARAARVDSPEDQAFDGRMAEAKARLEAMATRLAELATAPQPPLTGRAETAAMEAARARAQGIVDGRLIAARNDVGQGATEDLSNAEQAQTALTGHQTRIQTLLTELETQQDPAEQTRIRDAAARELEAAELAMQRASEASLRASTRENNTPEGFVADVLRQEADALQTRYEEAVRQRDELAQDHADFVSRMQRIPGAVTTMIGRVDAVSREAKAARTPALRAEKKGGPAADAAISAERLARERAEQTVDGYRQFIEGNEAFLSSGTALKAELTQAEANVMTLRQELETAQRAAQLAEGPARRAGTPVASPSSVAPRIGTIESAMAMQLQAARQGMHDLETRLQELRQNPDIQRDRAARDAVEAVKGRGLGARLSRMASGALGAVMGTVPAALGALNARSERKNATAHLAELDERFELRKTLRGLRAEDRTDEEIRDILNRIAHPGVRSERLWTQAVDYAFEEENTRRGRINVLRGARTTIAHHGRRLGVMAAGLGISGFTKAKDKYTEFMNDREEGARINTLAEVVLTMHGGHIYTHQAEIDHELHEHYGVPARPAEEVPGSPSIMQRIFDKASKIAMQRELERIDDLNPEARDPKTEAALIAQETRLKNLTGPQRKAQFIRDGLLPRNPAHANKLFDSVYKWRGLKEGAGNVLNFLVGKKGSARRGITLGVPLVLTGMGLVGGALVVNEIVEGAWSILKGAGRTVREGGKAVYNGPETVKETFTGRMKQAMSIWDTKTLKKEEVKKEDKFAGRWGKRFRNLGRSIVNPAIYLGSKTLTPFAMIAAGVTSPFEGMGRAALGLNPVGKRDTLTRTDDDHYKHAKRGGLLGVYHEFFNTAKDEQKAFVAAAQWGPFKGAFKKTADGQGWFGKLMPDVFNPENLKAFGHVLAGAGYLGGIWQFMNGKLMPGVTPPAPVRSGAGHGAGHGGDHGAGHGGGHDGHGGDHGGHGGGHDEHGGDHGGHGGGHDEHGGDHGGHGGGHDEHGGDHGDGHGGGHGADAGHGHGAHGH